MEHGIVIVSSVRDGIFGVTRRRDNAELFLRLSPPDFTLSMRIDRLRGGRGTDFLSFELHRQLPRK